MALKKKLDKAAYEKLSDVLKAEYKEDGDDYVLDVEGGDDAGELRRANERLKQEKKDLAAKAKDAQEKLDALGDDDARKRGDVVTLEKSWGEKLKQETDKRDAVIAKQKAHIQRQLVDNVAAKIAGDISDAPALLIPHIKSRLSADFDGDEPVTRVLDATGKPSAFTVDDLKKEISTDKTFAVIIRGSKSSGSGASGQQKIQAGGLQQYGNNNPDQQNLNPASMSREQLRERVDARVNENRNNQ